ncbi:MAG: hypothetical protein ACRD1Q_12670 [Vicinamibacterales bacterium]
MRNYHVVIRRALPVSLLLTFTLVAPGAARADNTVCTGAVFLIPDGSLHTGSFTAAGQLRWFRFAVKTDRSYAITVENPSPTDVQPYIEISEDQSRLGTCAGPEPDFMYMDSADPASGATMGVIGAARATYKSTSNTDFFFSLVNGVNGQSYRVRVQETTLFGAFFTTRNGFETYFRISNTTNLPLSVTLKLISDAGMAVANQTLTVAANATAPTIYTGSPTASATGLSVANDTTGQIIITHNGPPGGIAVDGYWGKTGGANRVAAAIRIEPARQVR